MLAGISIVTAALLDEYLAGAFVVYIGGDIFGAATRLDSDFRTPLGLLLSFGGLIVLAIPLVGLISIIGAGLAKSVAARVIFNALSVMVLSVVFGASMATRSPRDTPRLRVR